ncbi:uncharacterized protein [Ambystoma mexicanum]|uniref:uncharacterized protein isoform X2 n=1 Tax=Ambystoma mexicanum TaxID=8296 RepID=UPI0037E90A3C
MPSGILSRLKLSNWRRSKTLTQEDKQPLIKPAVSVPTRKTLNHLSSEQIVDSLNESSLSDLNGTISLCCKILKNPKEEMYTVKTLAMKLEVSLASWIPTVVSSNIVNLFNKGVIHYSAVAYMITELATSYAPGIKPNMQMILKKVINAMQDPSDLQAKFWLCRALSSLAELVPSTNDRLLLPLLRSGYWTCKVFYNVNKSQITPDDNVINAQFLITLGSLASILPSAVLGVELVWVSEEMRKLQQRLPMNMSVHLIQPLMLFTEFAIGQGSVEMIDALPTVLSILHHLIACSDTSEEGEEAQMFSTSWFAFLAHFRPSMVYGFINDILRKPGVQSRVRTVWLLHDLLGEIEFSDLEKAYYKHSFFQIHQDDNNQVIIAVLDLLTDLIDKGYYERPDTVLIKYLVNHSSLPDDLHPVYLEETDSTEEDDENRYIREKSFALLLKLISL